MRGRTHPVLLFWWDRDGMDRTFRTGWWSELGKWKKLKMLCFWKIRPHYPTNISICNYRPPESYFPDNTKMHSLGLQIHCFAQYLGLLDASRHWYFSFLSPTWRYVPMTLVINAAFISTFCSDSDPVIIRKYTSYYPNISLHYFMPYPNICLLVSYLFRF